MPPIKHPAAFAFTVLALASCHALPPPKSPAEALYRQRCGNCHELHPASAYSDQDWATNVRRMRSNAGLTQAELNQLVQWLQANNEGLNQ